MWRTARVATACTLISGFAWLAFAGEPAAPAVTLPEAKAPAAALPPAPKPAPAPEAVPAPVSKTRPTVEVLGNGENTDFEVGLPAGKIRVQRDPAGSRIFLTDPRGMTVELSRPSRQAVAAGAVAPEDPDAPQLKDLLIQSLMQTMATHRKVRVGRTQIQVQGAPANAPPVNVPETKTELGAPAELEEDAQSAVPVLPRAAEVVRAPSDAPVPAPAPAVVEPARTAKLEAVQAEALQAVPAQRRTVRIHKFVVPAGQAEDGDEAPPVNSPEERLAKRRRETLKAARAEVIRRVQAQEVQAVAPAARKLEAVPDAAVPLQAEQISPPAALTSRQAVRTAAPVGTEAVTNELAIVQKELAALTNELQRMSEKRRVRGESLVELVRKIGETNRRLEAARKTLPQ